MSVEGKWDPSFRRTFRPAWARVCLWAFSAALLNFSLPRDIAAADWKIYAGTDLGQYYYDADSVRFPSPGLVLLRHKVIFSEKGIRQVVESFGKAYQNLSYSVSLREILCKEKKIRSLGVTYFATKGEILDAAVDSASEWHDIAPTAVIEGLYQRVCR